MEKLDTFMALLLLLVFLITYFNSELRHNLKSKSLF